MDWFKKILSFIKKYGIVGSTLMLFGIIIKFLGMAFAWILAGDNLIGWLRERKQKSNKWMAIISWVKRILSFYKYGIIGSILKLLGANVKFVGLIFGRVVAGKYFIDWLDKRKQIFDEWKQYGKDQRETKKKLKDDKAGLLQQFECCWKKTVCSDFQYNTCDCTPEKRESCLQSQDGFLKLVLDEYAFSIYKRERNKKKNFFWKLMFVIVLLCGFAGFLTLLFWELRKGKSPLSALGKNSLLLILLILLSGIVAKWLDIKKYQETWGRHSNQCYLLEREMLLFVHDMPPYDTVIKKTVFFKNVVAIWDANQQKFVNNVEQKEKGLMDIFNRIKFPE